MHRWTVALVTLALGACAAPSPAPTSSVASPSAPASAAPPAPPSGVVLANIDTSVRPQDDLFRYVNGQWLARTEIPADRSNYGAFSRLQDDVENDLHAIAGEAAAMTDVPVGSRSQWLGDFYASYMDDAQANRLGAQPLAQPLAEIDAVRSRADLVAYFGRTQRHFVAGPPGVDDFGAAAPLRMAVDADAKHPDTYVVYVDQFGLGMPDPEYYVSKDAQFVEARAKYLAYATRLLELAGRSNAKSSAERVVALETRLAKVQWSQVELRDVDKAYNAYDIAGANKLTPGFDWNTWRIAAGIPKQERLIIGQPSYFTAMAGAVREVPLETWKDYLRVHVVDDLAPLLSNEFVQQRFEFRDRTLSGSQELKPRWKRGLLEVEFVLGDVLGEAYVQQHFPPEAKQRMDALVSNLLKAYAQSIDSLEWMGPDTRRRAREKLDQITVKIGYPVKWKEYPGLEVRRGDLVGNVLRAREANFRREIAKLGGPIDRTEWSMTPQTVNAYYNPLANEIVFPAAILQPPMFDAAADDAINYGAIGTVIGHEVSHAFDDQGRKFDGTGALRDWWTPDDDQRFKARAANLVKQYDGFTPLPGLHVNGELTLGENIGDLSGVAVAYKAWRMAAQDRPPPVLDGYTGEQRFFVGYCQIWARKYRDDELRKRLLTDPHSPGEYRCNGVVRNLPGYVAAFDVKPGDRMYLAPAEQVRIW